MALRSIVCYPEPLLGETSSPVEQFDKALHTLIDDMAETMYAANGIGLAAPQIGLLKQVVVIDTSRNGNQLLEIVNPTIKTAQGKVMSEEGCLSIPEYRDTVQRHRSVVVSGFNRHRQPIEIDADELLAICLQHEIDHLNGVLFIDRLSRLKREMFKRWFKKHHES